ncbi:MAG: phosphatidylserine decarboxylase family protein [Phycisphaerae bacterium]|nr:phosphatidylserine decarboxylase family protein [Phycisphaerae bacterium]
MLTTSYAGKEIALTLLVGLAVTVVIGWFFGWWAILPAVIALALLLFYRDPVRRIPEGRGLVLAPADGRIVAIERNLPGPDGQGRWLRIMTFLAVYNVHVNRSPCAGRVRGVEYKPGKFLNALRDEADACNECNTVTLTPAAPLPGPVYVRQIAGALARRIVCTLKEGQDVAAGERIGMIKLGSRTELRLPESDDWDVLVRVGQRVAAGKTVLLRLRTAVPAVSEARRPVEAQVS